MFSPAPLLWVLDHYSLNPQLGPQLYQFHIQHLSWCLGIFHHPMISLNVEGNLNPSMKSMIIYIAAGNFERDHVNPEDLSFLITIVFSVS